jgi:SNF family Na+-dependent transporter
MCFLSLFRGVKLSGKIGYFTAIFPYFVLILLGVRGAFLDGAAIGIEYYIKPDLKKLLEFGVWKDAAGKKNTFIYFFSRELRLLSTIFYIITVQVFFTLSLTFGGLVALSSYNKFDHNILRYISHLARFGFNFKSIKSICTITKVIRSCYLYQTF